MAVTVKMNSRAGRVLPDVDAYHGPLAVESVRLIDDLRARRGGEQNSAYGLLRLSRAGASSARPSFFFTLLRASFSRFCASVGARLLLR